MAGWNFFGNYFYGKPGQRDFTEADLPANRLQLFRDVLQVRRGSLVGVNLLYLLAWIPAIFWTFLNLVLLYQLDAADPAAFTAAAEGLMMKWLLLMFPLTAITGPFNMGVSCVLRCWARDEHSFVVSDFAQGLKANWKQGLLFGAVSGVLPLLSWICLRFYLAAASENLLMYLPLALTLIVYLMWNMAAQILPTMLVGYEQSFPAQLKNAVLMILADLPRAIAIRLATLALPLAAFIVLLAFPAAFGWVAGAVVVLYLIIMPAFNKLITASFANMLCEKYLNPQIDGAKTGIGLRPKHETEEKK